MEKYDTKAEQQLFKALDLIEPEALAKHGYVRTSFRSDPPSDRVRPEASCAAKWWAAQLRGVPKMDNGDAFHNAIAGYFVELSHAPLREKQIADFEGWLAWLLEKNGMSGWDKKDPLRGCAIRGIHNDYGADPVLQAACYLAGIDTGPMRFPIKTNMHINPGSVKVRHGYGSPEEELFAGK